MTENTHNRAQKDVDIVDVREAGRLPEAPLPMPRQVLESASRPGLFSRAREGMMRTIGA